MVKYVKIVKKKRSNRGAAGLDPWFLNPALRPLGNKINSCRE